MTVNDTATGREYPYIEGQIQGITLQTSLETVSNGVMVLLLSRGILNEFWPQVLALLSDQVRADYRMEVFAPCPSRLQA
jgi:hypothetical protein